MVDIGTLMHIKEIRVLVRNPVGRVRIEVDFDEVVWNGSEDVQRTRTLSDNHLTTKGGWRNIFTKVGPYTTFEGGLLKVDMKEAGKIGKWQRGKIRESIPKEEGSHKYERKDLRIVFNIAKHPHRLSHEHEKEKEKEKEKEAERQKEKEAERQKEKEKEEAERKAKEAEAELIRKAKEAEAERIRKAKEAEAERRRNALFQSLRKKKEVAAERLRKEKKEALFQRLSERRSHEAKTALFERLLEKKEAEAERLRRENEAEAERLRKENEEVRLRIATAESQRKKKEALFERLRKKKEAEVERFRIAEADREEKEAKEKEAARLRKMAEEERKDKEFERSTAENILQEARCLEVDANKDETPKEDSWKMVHLAKKKVLNAQELYAAAQEKYPTDEFFAKRLELTKQKLKRYNLQNKLDQAENLENRELFEELKDVLQNEIILSEDLPTHELHAQVKCVQEEIKQINGEANYPWIFNDRHAVDILLDDANVTNDAQTAEAFQDEVMAGLTDMQMG